MTDKLQIAVVKAFLLTLADGTVKKFDEGLHDVEESIASHWYVKAHSNIVEPVAEPAPPAAETPTPPPSDAEPAQTEPSKPDEAPAEAETPKRKK